MSKKIGKGAMGIALAGVAAAAFMGIGPAAAADDAGVVRVKCYGANSCKGQAECKTAASSCKGHNSCKGRGFVTMDEKACIERMGRT